MKKYVKLFRIKHYLKNVLIFLPIIFSSNLFNLSLLVKNIVGFFAFSLVTSVVYIINDIKDVEKDRKHPVKKNRPIANGDVSEKKAKLCIFFVLLMLFGVLYFNDLLVHNSILILLTYFFLNLGYSLGWKEIPIVDVVILASGFVFRVLYGGLITGVEVSNWLFLTILAVSFYMAMGKRRNEYLQISGNETRKVLKYYNKDFLDKMVNLFLGLSITFYSLWTILGISNGAVSYSVVFVIVILLKYSLTIEQGGFGDPIEVIFNDKILICLAVMYAIYMFVGMYLV